METISLFISGFPLVVLKGTLSLSGQFFKESCLLALRRKMELLLTSQASGALTLAGWKEKVSLLSLVLFL